MSGVLNPLPQDTRKCSIINETIRPHSRTLHSLLEGRGGTWASCHHSMWQSFSEHSLGSGSCTALGAKERDEWVTPWCSTSWKRLYTQSNKGLWSSYSHGLRKVRVGAAGPAWGFRGTSSSSRCLNRVWRDQWSWAADRGASENRMVQ